MNRNLLLLLVLVLIALYAASLFAGVAGDRAPSDFPPAWAENLGDLLVVQRPFAQQATTSGTVCQSLLDEGRAQLAAGSECVYRLEPASGWLRTVVFTGTLSLMSGSRVSIFTAHANPERWTPTVDLGPGGSRAIRLYAEGGRLHLTCFAIGPEPCRLQLTPSRP